MLEQTKKNLATGITRVKWIASFIAERAKTETSKAKIFYERNKLEKSIDGLYRDIGRRVRELKEQGEADVLNDGTVQQALNEIETLGKTVSDYKKKADNMSKMPE